MEQSLVLMDTNVVAVVAGWVRRWRGRRGAHRHAPVDRPGGPPRTQERTRAPEELTWVHWSILILLLLVVLALLMRA